MSNCSPSGYSLFEGGRVANAKRLDPRKRPVQRRSQETRQRILTAAARVFADHGYAAGTTNRIAEAAGLSIGSLYQYFPNKDAVLVELVKAHVNQGLSIIQDHLADQGLAGTLEGRLRTFVRAAIENHLDEPRLHRVLFEEAPRPPDLLAMLHAAEAWTVAGAKKLLEEDPEVTVADTATAARLVVAAIESLVHRFFASDLPGDVDRFEDELVAMLHRYLHSGP
jgi:AcrR family transcriptional regulator